MSSPGLTRSGRSRGLQSLFCGSDVAKQEVKDRDGWRGASGQGGGTKHRPC